MQWLSQIHVGQTGNSFKTRYTEHMKALTQPLEKSNFAEHIFRINHSYYNIKTNLGILYTLLKGPKQNSVRYTNTINNRN